MAKLETISDTARPAPKRFACRRTNQLPMPASGASTTRFGIGIPPRIQGSRRLLAIAVSLGTALLAPAAADAAVCTYVPPPPPKVDERKSFLEFTIRVRRHLTLRSDRAYVRRVNADPANHERSLLDFPMTPPEVDYFVRRNRLTEGAPGRRLNAYMRRHRDDFAPISIEDDYPRPYVQLRATRRLAEHRAAIRRLYPYRFKIQRVPFSGPELRRIQNAIMDDQDALAAQGVHVITAGLRSGRVTLGVATERADVRAVVRARYGAAVRLKIYGPTPTVLECDGPASYEVHPDGRTLTVHFYGSGSITPREVEVAETDYGVDLGVVYETPYIVTADRQHYTLTVTLAKPLGDRPVRSFRYGYTVKRGTPS